MKNKVLSSVGTDSNPKKIIKTNHNANESPQKVTSTQKFRYEHADFPQDLDLSSLNECIGHGYCGNVFKYNHNGVDLALKCCDKINNREGYKMMKNEIKVYERLQALQGKKIPRLHWWGFSLEIFIIATTFIEDIIPSYYTKPHLYLCLLNMGLNMVT